MKRSLVILLTAVSISAMTAGTAFRHLQKPQRLKAEKPQMVQRKPQTANLKTVFTVV